MIKSGVSGESQKPRTQPLGELFGEKEIEENAGENR